MKDSLKVENLIIGKRYVFSHPPYKNETGVYIGLWETDGSIPNKYQFRIKERGSRYLYDWEVEKEVNEIRKY